MLKTQVRNMLNMDDAALKRYLQKECKHKEELLCCIAIMRNDAHHNRDEALFDRLSWLQRVLKGTDILCP